MARNLRARTKEKTEASAKAAEDTKSARQERPRKQRYKCNKGLVSLKVPKELRSITLANATGSPLLRLPAEIRAMIFKLAVSFEYPWDGLQTWIGCYYNRHGGVSRSRSSMHIRKSERRLFAISLPRVCRLIYSETATLVYTENTFAFQNEKAMHKWLAKRLLAQREAIRYIMLPTYAYEYRIVDDDMFTSIPILGEITQRTKRLCPNLVEMKDDSDGWLHDSLVASPAEWSRDPEFRYANTSSEDNFTDYGSCLLDYSEEDDEEA